MKFGKELRARLYQPWKDFYVPYKKLKKIINKANNPRLSEKEKERIKQLFFKEVKGSLNLSERFYRIMVQKMMKHEKKLRMDYAERLRSILAGKRVSNPSGCGGSSPPNGLIQSVDQVCKVIQLLEEFCYLNAEGYRKIVKKWDKKMDDSTLPEFMKLVSSKSFVSCEELNKIGESANTTQRNLDMESRTPNFTPLDNGQVGVHVVHGGTKYVVHMSPLLLPEVHPEAKKYSSEAKTLIFMPPVALNKRDREFHEFLLDEDSDSEQKEGEPNIQMNEACDMKASGFTEASRSMFYTKNIQSNQRENFENERDQTEGTGPPFLSEGTGPAYRGMTVSDHLFKAKLEDIQLSPSILDIDKQFPKTKLEPVIGIPKPNVGVLHMKGESPPGPPPIFSLL